MLDSLNGQLCPKCESRPLDRVLGYCIACYEYLNGRVRALCPACAIRGQDPQLGLCTPCWKRRLQGDSIEQERALAEAQRGAWRLRQQRSRTNRRLRPIEIPDFDSFDPAAAAEEAISLLNHVKGPGMSPHQQARVDAVIELIKQLACPAPEALLAEAR
jgi:hypothetical protein